MLICKVFMRQLKKLKYNKKKNLMGEILLDFCNQDSTVGLTETVPIFYQIKK